MSAFDPQRTLPALSPKQWLVPLRRSEAGIWTMAFDLDQIQGRHAQTIVNDVLAFCAIRSLTRPRAKHRIKLRCR